MTYGIPNVNALSVTVLSAKLKLGPWLEELGGVWYMHLKIENCYLKTCVKIRVDEKVCGSTYNIV